MSQAEEANCASISSVTQEAMAKVQLPITCLRWKWKMIAQVRKSADTGKLKEPSGHCYYVAAVTETWEGF